MQKYTALVLLFALVATFVVVNTTPVGDHAPALVPLVGSANKAHAELQGRPEGRPCNGNRTRTAGGTASAGESP